MKLIIKNLFFLLLLTCATSHIHAIIATPEQEAMYNQEIIDARSQTTVAKQVEAFTNIIREQNNTAAKLPRFTNQNQLNFFSAIIPLAKQKTQDAGLLNNIKTLVQEATTQTNTMLQPGQKGYLTTKLLPTITQQLSQLPAQPQTPQQPAQTPQPVAQAATPITQPVATPAAPANIPPKPTSQTNPITIAMLQNSLNQTNSIKRLRNVQAFLTLAEGFTFTPDIQNVFSQLIVKIAQDAKLQRSKSQELKLALMQASTSPLLAAAQQAYVSNTLLQARSTTPQAQPVAKKKKNKKKTQQPVQVTQPIQTVQPTQQSVQAKQPLQATQQPALYPTVAPATTTQPPVAKKIKKVKKSKPAAAQSGDKKPMNAIKKALKQTTTNAQINALLTLANTSQNQHFMPTTQDAFGNALITIFKNRSSYRSAEQLLLKKLLIKAQTTPLLSPAQQKYVTTSMMKQLE